MKNFQRDIRFNTSEKEAKVVFYLPLWISGAVFLLLLIPVTRDFGFWMLKENHPVEIGTFLLFFFGGLYGIINFIRYRKSLPTFAVIFYCLFAFFFILLAMEEIAWGQWFFKFQTPEDWAAVNVQNETTLHNLEVMQENNDLLRLIYGVGGLIGIFFGTSKFLRELAVPQFLLLWFVIIAAHSVLDIVVDWSEKDYRIMRPIIRFNEVTEFLIAFSGVLYLRYNLIRKKASSENL